MSISEIEAEQAYLDLMASREAGRFPSVDTLVLRGAVAPKLMGHALTERFDMIALEVGHGKRMGRRQGHELRALGVEERVRTDEKGFGPPARESRERRVDLRAGAGVEDLHVEA